MALAGGVGYVVTGLGVPGLPEYATGFVLWPAVLGMSVGALLAAPGGVALAHRLPAARLRSVFAVLVAVMGIDLILG